MELDLYRKKIRSKTYKFFKKLNYKKIPVLELYSTEYKTTNNLLYSAEIGAEKYPYDNSVVIQPCSRIEDFNSELNHKLPIFSQLSILSKSDNKKLLKNSLQYLVDFCKCDVKKIGLVVALNNPDYNFKDYEKIFLNYGIDKKQILFLDYPENKKLFWEYPGYPKYNGYNLSIYYSYKSKNNIKEFDDYTKWLEIGEIAFYNSCIQFGMERIEKTFFNIEYPKYNYKL